MLGTCDRCREGGNALSRTLSVFPKWLCTMCMDERREYGFKDGYDEGQFAGNIAAWDCENLKITCGRCQKCLGKVRAR